MLVQREMIISNLKHKLKTISPIYAFYTMVRAKSFEIKAALEKNRYALATRKKGVNYSQDAAVHFLKQRLANRGISPKLKNGLHIFTAFRHFNWERHNLIPALEKLGRVAHFDWYKEGYDEFSPTWNKERRKEMNNVLIEVIKHAHKDQPIDIFFAYTMNCHITYETVIAINKMGIITINMTLNDHHAFWGKKINDLQWGVAPNVSAFDLNCTCNTDSFIKYLIEGGIPYFFPEAANPDFYRDYQISKDIDLSFVGKCYGHRPLLINYLRKHGIKVETFGAGWPNGEISTSKQVEIFNRSRINLGIGGVGYSKKIVDIKGRDFEIPMCRGFYLTQHNPELALCYMIDKEIVCYHNYNDLVKKIRFYLNNSDRAEAIRMAGHKRALCDHTWNHRFEKLFNFIGLKS